MANHSLHEKSETIRESFVLHKDLRDDFSEICKRLGLNKSATYRKLMQDFIDKNKRKKGKQNG